MSSRPLDARRSDKEDHVANVRRQSQIHLLEPSFKSLLIQLRVSGNPLAMATAFIALSSKGPVLITNRHNLTGRHNDTGQVLSATGGVPDEVFIWHNHASNLGQWVMRAEPLYRNNTPLWREHPSLGEKADIVALPLTSLHEIAPRAYDLVETDPSIAVMPSDIVSVVGFPFGLTGGGAIAIWVTGFISSEPSLDFMDLPIFLIDCRSRQGQSGSPVIAHRNGGAVTLEDGSTAFFNGPVTRFLGAYSGRINAESDIGLVWKASAVSELVASI
jgi:hypothetical protein